MLNSIDAAYVRARLVSSSVLALAALSVGAGAAGAQGSWAVLKPPTDADLRKLSFVSNDQGWVAGLGGTILMTTDGGNTWAKQTLPVTTDIIDIDMVSKTAGWAVAHDFGTPNTTLLWTTDGQTWTVRHEFDQVLLAASFRNETHGCIVGDGGTILRTIDGGLTWMPADIRSPETANWPIHEVDFLSDTFAVAMGGMYDVTGVVWRTTDGGEHWTHGRVAGEPVFGAWAFSADEILCVGGDLDYGAGMVRTQQAGETWEYTDLLMWGQAQAVSFRNEFEGWAPLGVAATIMFSTDAGYTWRSIDTPEHRMVFDVQFTSSDVGFMVGDDGTILRYIPGGGSTGVSEMPVGSTLRNILYQNHPNPFAPFTEIRFQTAQDGLVTLKVYDLSGREVATLVNEELPAGVHKRKYEAAGDLTSGVYYYKLSAGGKVETKTMVLLR